MTEIRILEDAVNEGKRYGDINVNPTFADAYFYSKDAGNDLINFGEVIWEHDIEAIIENCRRFGIKEFTISSTFSSLITTIAEFEKKGANIGDLVEINSRYDDWRTGEKEILPALKMTIA